MSPMAIITEKSVVFLLVIGFLQVQARSTEFAFGQRGHIDSGQNLPPQALTTLALEVPKEGSQEWLGSSRDNENYDDDKDDEFFSAEAEEFLHGEKENKEELGSEESSEEESYDSGDMISENYSEKSDEESAKGSEGGGEKERIKGENLDDFPLKRVRRRIIPVGGATIDRTRGGRGNNGRSRSPWAESHQYGRQKESVIRRRNGPTGSAALFSLYPELAPPGWKSKRGAQSAQKKKNKKGKSQQAGTEISGKKSREEIPEEKPQSDERAKVSSADATLMSKRSSKLSRGVKEEIAMFAERHGIDRAVMHFKSRVDVPLRANMVEKFLRRYQNRMQRRANRS